MRINPDKQERNFLEVRGEWGINGYEAFDRHLRKLHEAVLRGQDIRFAGLWFSRWSDVVIRKIK